MLRRYHSDASHIIEYEILEIQPDLSYEEKPVKILDQKEQVLRNKTIPLVRVLWRNQNVEESTWEMETEHAGKVPTSVFLKDSGTESP